MGGSVEAAQTVSQNASPNRGCVDRRRGASAGLSVVHGRHAHDATMLIGVLTGFASIATAVEAIKLGACNYLVKPSNTDDIEAEFSGKAGNVDVPFAARPTSNKTLE